MRRKKVFFVASQARQEPKIISISVYLFLPFFGVFFGDGFRPSRPTQRQKKSTRNQESKKGIFNQCEAHNTQTHGENFHERKSSNMFRYTPNGLKRFFFSSCCWLANICSVWLFHHISFLVYFIYSVCFCCSFNFFYIHLRVLFFHLATFLSNFPKKAERQTRCTCVSTDTKIAEHRYRCAQDIRFH